MDSLYLNTPKPFTKYPTGYRPVNSSLAGARRFGSVSSLSNNYNFNDCSPNQQHHHSTSYHQQYSPNNPNSFAEVTSQSSKSYRYGSVGPYGEMPQDNSALSSRAASPQRYIFPQTPNLLESSVIHSEVPRTMTGEEFLEKLRRQKEEIERTLSKPLVSSYIQSPPPYGSEECSPMMKANFHVHDNMPNHDSRFYTNSAPTPLFKTRSESVIDYDRKSYPHISPMNDQKMCSSFNGQFHNSDQFSPPQHFNRLSMPPPPTRSIDDQNLHCESNWMTHPPPPINMDPKPHRKDFNGNYGDSLSFNLNESFKNGQTIVPIKLDDDRILKIYAPQIQPQNDAVSSPLNIKTGQHTPVSNPLLPASVPREVKPFESNSYPTSPYDLRFEPSSDNGPTWNSPVSAPNSFIQPPPPKYHQHNPRADSTTSRSMRVGSVQDVSRDSYIAKDYDSNNFPEIPLSVRENNIPVVSQRTRPSPFNSRLDEPSRRDSFFGPVSSKVFPGHSRINGFINDSTQASAGTFQQVEQTRTSAPKERSFAIVSRPSSPPVSVESTTRTIPNHTLRQRDFSPSRMNERPFTLSSPTQEPSSPRSISFSPTNSITTRSLGSPMSCYDNDSETEPQQNKWNLRNDNVSQHRAIQPLAQSTPQGILVKNHDGSRPQKRVVFQCDAEMMDRLRTEYGIASSPSEAPSHVQVYEDIVESVLEPFYKLSDEIGGDVQALKNKIASTFDHLKNFLWIAAGRTEPADNDVQGLVAPMVKLLGEISEFKDSKKGSAVYNHCCAVAEGIPAVGWVLIKKTPAAYVKDMLEASMFYVNKILKEFKASDPKQADWAKAWKEILELMCTFVRKTHTTGLVWNSAPGSVPPSGSAAPAKSGPPPPPAGGPPPPPPPPPTNLMAGISSGPRPVNGKVGRNALFAEINKGENITANLKKVHADMQNHKNSNTNASSYASVKHTGGLNGHVASKVSGSRTPKIELHDGKQWNIEYQVNNRNIVINIDDKKQTMYVFKCENCVIQVKGKLNSITLDGCKKTSIVFDALVAQCETINCQSVQIQTMGEMPTLSIQKTDGCQVYLSEASLGAEIVTSKSSEMNILIPVADGEFNELAVPEQFKTVIERGKLVTVASDII